MELKSRKSSDFSQEMKFEINNLETEIKEFESKNEAMAYEKWLKSGVGRVFVKTLEH